MTTGRLILGNIVLVLAVGGYGLATDEPYWAAVGHAPWLYDYLFWGVLALNGPSRLLAERLTGALVFPATPLFVVQYVVWLPLVVIQWLGYAAIAEWASQSSALRKLVQAGAILLLLAGAFVAARLWLTPPPTSDAFFEVHFWPVRIAGLGLAGAWIALMVGWFRAPAPAAQTSA